MRMPDAPDQANEEVEFFGTPNYASLTGLQCLRCSPRDDLESLCYRCGMSLFTCTAWSICTRHSSMSSAQLPPHVGRRAALVHTGKASVSAQLCAPLTPLPCRQGSACIVI